MCRWWSFHLGHFLCICSYPAGIDDSNGAELKAIGKALELLFYSSSIFHGVFSIILEPNSRVALSWIHNLDAAPWHLPQTINSVCSKLSILPNISFCHVLREENAIADSLSKQGLNRSEDFVAFF
ncbi:hypothetical protein P3X46_004681 [Hevea brasiliensis]|uniref:RNase H type-1 domain-containing protein n=1 Tax=Hevea brasiliensis TaxID=3981 RepID=A0ABQ9N0C0_HEVBR|nr:hypothetical protein P3X46_004681 [Hevea brasiliensis]